MGERKCDSSGARGVLRTKGLCACSPVVWGGLLSSSEVWVVHLGWALRFCHEGLSVNPHSAIRTPWLVGETDTMMSNVRAVMEAGKEGTLGAPGKALKKNKDPESPEATKASIMGWKNVREG